MRGEGAEEGGRGRRREKGEGVGVWREDKPRLGERPPI
jgi:hypothetical protein